MGRLSTPEDLARVASMKKQRPKTQPKKKRRKRSKASKNSQRRGQLKARDGWKCWLCGRSPKFLTIDHMWPKAHGGCNCIDNLALACGKCNQLRGDQIAPEGHKREDCPRRRKKKGETWWPQLRTVQRRWGKFRYRSRLLGVTGVTYQTARDVLPEPLGFITRRLLWRMRCAVADRP